MRVRLPWPTAVPQRVRSPASRSQRYRQISWSSPRRLSDSGSLSGVEGGPARRRASFSGVVTAHRIWGCFGHRPGGRFFGVESPAMISWVFGLALGDGVRWR